MLRLHALPVEAAEHGTACAAQPARVRSAERFRNGMSRLAGACTIVTSCHDGERARLTATAACSASAEPPRLLVCLNSNVWAYGLISIVGSRERSSVARTACFCAT